jgi:23S rRNA (guanosine2251-2'-O)-methyltransferase
MKKRTPKNKKIIKNNHNFGPQNSGLSNLKKTAEKRYSNSTQFKPKFNSQLNLGSEIWLCGKHPIFNILQKKRRKIFQILATQNTILELEEFLQKNSLSHLRSLIELVSNEKIESVVGKNQIHQGFAAKCSKIPTTNQNQLLAELEKIPEGQKLPTLILLDQVSDPHNVGAIIRSAISFGVNKIIFSEHNSPKESATIVKSSAGTIEMADLVVVTNFSNLIEKLKKLGYWCIGLAGEGTAALTTIKEYKNVALIIGSEGDGIRSLVKKNCDLLVKIEIDQEVESLNASVAAAIALYELQKPSFTK